MSYLFGIELPETSKSKILEIIEGLNSNSKNSLYFLYSEFLLRSKINPSYKKVLLNSELLAIDGKGTLWAKYRVQKRSLLPTLFKKFGSPLPKIIRGPIYVVLFFLQLVYNLFNLFWVLFRQTDFFKLTGSELIMGREFVYDLLEIADQNSWKVLIIGGGGHESVTKINQIHPKLDIRIWSKPADSDLMRDRVCHQESLIDKNLEPLTSQNVTKLFPDLEEAKNLVIKTKPDLILVTLGGRSGKQELFVDNLKNDQNTSFRLATGLGAALDHLGGGARQVEAPKWMQLIGLEWLFRFVKQPYRRKRIIDSVLGLWFWTTWQEFATE